jgi:hypothetical protein
MVCQGYWWHEPHADTRESAALAGGVDYQPVTAGKS